MGIVSGFNCVISNADICFLEFSLAHLIAISCNPDNTSINRLSSGTPKIVINDLYLDEVIYIVLDFYRKKLNYFI